MRPLSDEDLSNPTACVRAAQFVARRALQRCAAVLMAAPDGKLRALQERDGIEANWNSLRETNANETETQEGELQKERLRRDEMGEAERATEREGERERERKKERKLVKREREARGTQACAQCCCC
jgi:hypothetical protein